MRRVSTSGFFAGLLLSSFFVAGQQVQTQNWRGADNGTVIAGHFDMDKRNDQRNITEHINVNYALSPRPFSTSLKLELNTALPTLFSADIVDAKGQKVKHWEPRVKSYRYEEVIDISSLAPGDYRLNIFSGLAASVQHSIPFSKVKTN